MVLQSIDSTVLDALRRTPDAFAHHEYWRAVTPLVVHAGGWAQYLANVVLLLAFGALLERRVGGLVTLVIYLASGIVAQFLGFAWRPHGAGASVGVAGLIGAFVVLRTWHVDRRMRVVLALVLMAIILILLRTGTGEAQQGTA